MKKKLLTVGMTSMFIISIGLTGCGTMTSTNNGSTDTNQDTSAPDNQGSLDKASGDTSNQKPITKEQAGKIVTDNYGGTVINVEKEHDNDNNGHPVYEVEVKNSEQGRIEVDVDIYTGKIVDFEKD